jgi:hypothetical protein
VDCADSSPPRPSRRNSSRRIALPLPASRGPCFDWGLNGGDLSRDRTCADRTAALTLDFDAGPQRLEIVVAKELQCLREMLGQRNPGSIRQLPAGTGSSFSGAEEWILALVGLDEAISCRLPHHAGCSNVQSQPSFVSNHADADPTSFA